MRVSVVLCSYGRPAVLDETVDSLMKQTHLPNGDPDRKPVARARAAAHDCTRGRALYPQPERPHCAAQHCARSCCRHRPGGVYR